MARPDPRSPAPGGDDVKLSQKRRDAIYKAIHERVMMCRITLSRRGLSSDDDLCIAQTVDPIFRGVLKALDVEEHPHD